MCCSSRISTGPLLFLIYSTDLPISFKFLLFYLFVDGTNAYSESNDFSILTRKVNKELTIVKYWLDCNKLAVHIDKTNVVYFHSKEERRYQTQ